MAEYRCDIHEPLQLHYTVTIGDGSVLWPFSTYLEGTTIGRACTLGTCCFVGRRVRIGHHVTLHTGVQIPDGAIIGDWCMLGPNAVLTDCLHPNLRHRDLEVHRPPVLEDDVSLGANCVILPGVHIGAGAQIGAGAVVTRDVAAGAIVMGNPARQRIPFQVPERLGA
jgi:UDP-2-acetamido-3-amino-2,3-dideoxy-glucuronate N-acetyltransferase